MIELVSVNVSNFRSFNEGEFTPLGMGQGMTAINGTNGMGKSSIVHAITWAMFGVTPDGVAVRALRRQGSEGDVTATVTFRHDGQTIEVTRALRGRNDTTMASIKVDGVEQTNISSKTATSWMENRLGLDAEAFLTAFVVRQKELDSLVKARPADRRKTIERLAGIERMSIALDLARQEARTANKILDAMPVAETPEFAEKRVKAAEVLVAETSSAYEEAVAVHETAKKRQASIENEVAAGRDAFDTLQAAKAALDLATQKLETAQEAVDKLQNVTAEKVDVAAAQTKVEAARSARSAAEQTINSVDAAQLQVKSATDKVISLENDILKARNTADKAASELASLGNPVDIVALESQIAQTEKDLELIGEARGAARGEWERLKKSITELQNLAAGNHAECPTCAHPLSDPTSLIAGQELLLGQVREKGTELTQQYDTINATLTELRSDLQKAQSEDSRRTQIVKAIADAEKTIAEFTARLNPAQMEAEDLAKKAAEAVKNAEDATANLPTLIAEEENAQKELRKAETIAQALAELAEAETKLETASFGHDSASIDFEAATNAVAIYDVPAMKAELADATLAANEAANIVSSKRTEHSLAQRDLTEAGNAYARALEAGEQRKEALAEVERATAVASALEEFRRDRLARLAPELSEVASDFVSRMTEGRYTTVELDEDFTPILTEASGDLRPVAWLSGGEESVVALALRIAIGEVLAGQRGGLLILDEVLTAQDTGRRQATMGAIRSLPRQIITINHVSESTDMVDLVADVVAADDGDGSTIVMYAPDHAVSHDLSDSLVDG